MRFRGKLEQHRSLVLVVCAFVLGILISFPVQYAVAAMTDTTYYACVKTADGILRIVSATTTCKSSETLISWNQQGPQGPAGPQGPQGPAGSGGDIFSLKPFLCNTCDLSVYPDKFQGKDWSNTQMMNVYINNVDIHGVNFSGSYMNGDVLSNDNLSGANFTNLKQFLGGNTLADITFDGSDLTNADFSNNPNGFFRVSFAATDLTGANFTNDTFQRTFFTNANFQGANLTNVSFSSITDLTGAQNMIDAIGLDSVTWEGVTCPDGTNSQDDGNTCVNNLTPAP